MNVKIGHFQAPLFCSEKLWVDHEFGWNRNWYKAYLVSFANLYSMHWSRPFFLRSLRFLNPILAQRLAFRLNLTVFPILHPLVGDFNHRWWRICPQILDKGPLSRSKHSDYICGFCRRSTKNRQQNPSMKLNCRKTNTILRNCVPVTIQYMYLAIIERGIAFDEKLGSCCWQNV